MIEINNVSIWFGEEQALKSVNLELESGKIHGIIGNNGSGKTVLFKCICGFLKPKEGYIVVDGNRVGKDTDFPSGLGIIIETPGFLPHETGLRNLQILASLKGKLGKNQIKEVLKKVGLDPSMKKHVCKYSLGMRQRLGIAQAIMENPDTLILDEPFNGLDKKGVGEIREIILELKKENKTILIASHNAEDIQILCDNVYEMDGGLINQVR